MATQIKEGVMRRMYRPFKLKGKPDESGMFEGYGSVFGVKDSYDEIVVPGAFAKSLDQHKAEGTMPKMLWQHDWDKPIGVYTAMAEDERGLALTGKLLKDGVQQAKEAHVLMGAGALDGLSIGYIPIAWRKSEQDKNIIELTEVDLWEVSIVTFPANPAARVTEVRALPQTVREFERLLRDAGYSERAAVAIATRGFKAQDDARDGQVMTDVLEALKRRTTIFQS